MTRRCSKWPVSAAGRQGTTLARSRDVALVVGEICVLNKKHLQFSASGGFPKQKVDEPNRNYRAQHEERNLDMPRKDRPTDPAEIQRSIEEAIQELVTKGLVVDSGQRRWSQRTGRYEIVWESKLFGKTFH